MTSTLTCIGYRESQESLQKPSKAARLLCALVSFVTLMAAWPAAVWASQTYGTDKVASSRNTLGPSVHSAPFTFEGAAPDVLRDLWTESVELDQEVVACVGGHYDDGAFHVTHAEPVRSSATDTGADAAPSLESCGPPNWAGTVHTHIAKFSGRPYTTFSAPDRGVMRAWELRWKAEGVFCVLYSEALAYCEYGSDLSGDVSYTSDSETGGSTLRIEATGPKPRN